MLRHAGDDRSPRPNAYYCEARATEPVRVSAGHFSIDYGNISAPEYTRTGEFECTPGTYCADDATSQPCPVGRYGDAFGLTNASCSGECSGGYFCPAGSTSPREENCGIGATPAAYYG